MFNSVHARPQLFEAAGIFVWREGNTKKPFSSVNASIYEINNSLIIKILIKQ